VPGHVGQAAESPDGRVTGPSIDVSLFHGRAGADKVFCKPAR
jgi:hypothetical protein